MSEQEKHDAVTARLRAAGCVFAEQEADELLRAAAAGARGAGWLESAVRRRADGEPLEHLVGSVVFDGLRLAVAPGVFVPRARTALLVRAALEGLTERPADAVLVDLCCGVGAVAAAVGARRPGLLVVAADLDAAATACAERNLASLGERAEVVTGDLYAPLPERLRGRVDVIIANAPYVPTASIAQMPREAREHEPLLALDGGDDGAAVHRRVVAGARAWLRPGGLLAIETADDAATALAALMSGAGMSAAVHEDDESGAVVVSGVVASRP